MLSFRQPLQSYLNHVNSSSFYKSSTLHKAPIEYAYKAAACTNGSNVEVEVEDLDILDGVEVSLVQ